MGALSLVLPLTALYLLPSVPNISDLGKVATTAVEQLTDLVGDVSAPKGILKIDEELEPERMLLTGFLNPPGLMGPVISSRSDATKVNVGFRAKVESKNVPSIRDHAGILMKTSKGATAERNSKHMIAFHPYVLDVMDALREKFAKAGIPIGADGSAALVDNRAKNKRNYIRLCRRLSGPTASLMQKLHGKDCVKLPRSEFYLEQGTKDGASGHVGLKIVAKSGNEKDRKDSESGSGEYRQPDDVMVPIDASISDSSGNYDESTDRLNVKTIGGKVAGKLLRDGKFSLAASINDD